MRFCIIDDNRMVTDALAMVLRDLGHTVDIAHDGVTGVALAQEGNHDAVVVDLHLPGMDGAEVVAELKRATTSAALIASSGNVVGAEAMREAGADEFLAKPFTPGKLVALAAQLIAARAA